jgi:serine/threonine protein kinase
MALSNLRGPPPIFPIYQEDDNRDAGGSSRPSYLVEGIFAREIDPRMFSGAAKIGDWGDAFFNDDPPVRTAWCGPYMTPEFNSPGSITMAEDVWMLGCAIFQMLTGRDLFGKKNDPSSKVLQAMVRLLGPPPDHFVADWRSYVEEMEGGPLSLSVERPTRFLKQKVVESISQSYGSNVVSEHDLINLGSLLESMLVWDPSQRLTIGEVADHAAMSFFLL